VSGYPSIKNIGSLVFNLLKSSELSACLACTQQISLKSVSNEFFSNNKDVINDVLPLWLGPEIISVAGVFRQRSVIL
jgi:hypothetical protein